MAVESAVVTITAPELAAVWIHDPDSPQDTARRFLYSGGSRGRARARAGVATNVAGRALPVFDIGEHRTDVVSLSLTVPFGDEWEEEVEYLHRLVDTGRAHIYRDDRARLLFAVALDISEADEPYGTVVTLDLQATNFDEAAYYVQYATPLLAEE